MENSSTNKGEGSQDEGLCSCVTDPFSAVPVELRPQTRKNGSLRRVECPHCGKEYLTNRQVDVCLDCERAPAGS